MVSEQYFHLKVVSGLEMVISEAIRTDLGWTPWRVDSGFLSFKTESPDAAGSFLLLPYLGSVFEELERTSSRNSSLDQKVVALARKLEQRRPANRKRRETYWLRVSVHGVLSAISPSARRSLAASLASVFGLRESDSRSQWEVWVIVRQDWNESLLCVRLDEPGRNKTSRGVLSPDLCAALVRIAPISSTDRVLDPFAGSGAILRARSFYAARSLTGTDRVSSPKLDRRTKFKKLDFLDVVERRRVLGSGRYDCVITDPPWGYFDEAVPMDFSSRMFEGFMDVLTPTGCAVVLTADPRETVNSATASGFRLVSSHNLLVHGKKAAAMWFDRDRELGQGHD
jgi:Putative RNA methylase family UPF0020